MITSNNAKVLLNYEPFRIDVFMEDELVMSVNPNNALKFEQFKKKVCCLITLKLCGLLFFELLPFGLFRHFLLIVVQLLIRYVVEFK